MRMIRSCEKSGCQKGEKRKGVKQDAGEYRVPLPLSWLLVLSTELYDESDCDGEWCIPEEEPAGGAGKNKGGVRVARLGRSRIGANPARYARGQRRRRLPASALSAVDLELPLCEVEWEVELSAMPVWTPGTGGNKGKEDYGKATYGLKERRED
ncbi:hypothetical protein DFH09DRAFT_1285824 [Mycena vulgaris]|nr:hypothetical protein DFH09DRAFT_1285824 [Mycena vulgaris]